MPWAPQAHRAQTHTCRLNTYEHKIKISTSFKKREEREETKSDLIYKTGVCTKEGQPHVWSWKLGQDIQGEEAAQTLGLSLPFTFFLLYTFSLCFLVPKENLLPAVVFVFVLFCFVLFLALSIRDRQRSAWPLVPVKVIDWSILGQEVLVGSFAVEL